MKKIIIVLLLSLAFFMVSMPIPKGVKKTVKTEKRFANLTSNEKKEAIAYLLSTGGCEWQGIKLYGKVQFVNSFPDIKIQYVESFPDIKVKFVESFPGDCGEWQKVSSFPDFKVQVVESFPDIKVQVVESFPGMNN